MASDMTVTSSRTPLQYRAQWVGPLVPLSTKLFVHSVYEHALNLETPEEELVACLVSGSGGRYAFSIAIPDALDFTKLGFKQGDEVEIGLNLVKAKSEVCTLAIGLIKQSVIVAITKIEHLRNAFESACLELIRLQKAKGTDIVLSSLLDLGFANMEPLVAPGFMGSYMSKVIRGLGSTVHEYLHAHADMEQPCITQSSSVKAKEQHSTRQTAATDTKSDMELHRWDCNEMHRFKISKPDPGALDCAAIVEGKKALPKTPTSSSASNSAGSGQAQRDNKLAMAHASRQKSGSAYFCADDIQDNCVQFTDFNDMPERGLAEAPLLFFIKSLIGSGTGLTPAGDDFICGLLAGFDSCDTGTAVTRVRWVLEDAVAQAAYATTDLSYRSLRAALENAYPPDLSDLAVAIAQDKPMDTHKCLKLLLNVGHSSGLDLACGFLYALALAKGFACSKKVLQEA